MASSPIGDGRMEEPRYFTFDTIIGRSCSLDIIIIIALQRKLEYPFKENLVLAFCVKDRI